MPRPSRRAIPDKLAYITQTTLSVDDTARHHRHPRAALPRHPRAAQARTSATPPRTARRRSRPSPANAMLMLVVGAPNSSNSQRLVEVARTQGCERPAGRSAPATSTGWLIGDAATIGITAGASAPEVLVNEVIDAFKSRYDVTVEIVRSASTSSVFKLPRELRRESRLTRPVTSGQVDIFTDGACSGNPGPGGWGAVSALRARREGAFGRRAADHQQPHGADGRDPRARGAEAALPGRAATPTAIYVRDGITRWIHGWRRNGWKTADRKPVKNAELWQELLEAAWRRTRSNGTGSKAMPAMPRTSAPTNWPAKRCCRSRTGE